MSNQIEVVLIRQVGAATVPTCFYVKRTTIPAGLPRLDSLNIHIDHEPTDVEHVEIRGDGEVWIWLADAIYSDLDTDRDDLRQVNWETIGWTKLDKHPGFYESLKFVTATPLCTAGDSSKLGAAP